MELFILSIVLCLVKGNQVWGGDFQFFNGTFTCGALSDQCLASVNSSSNHWYLADMSPIQIKFKVNYPTSKCVDLSSLMPVTLCQNVILKIGKKYLLSYSLFCQYRIENMTLYAYLNEGIVSSLHIKNSNSFNSTQTLFFAQKQENVICFNQSHSARQKYQNFSYMISVGGMIDNISITQARNYVNFLIKICEVESKILIRTNISCYQKISALFKQQYNIKCHEEVLPNFDFYCQEDNFYSIQIEASKSYYIKHLNFIQIQSNPNIIIVHETVDKYFHYLDTGNKELCKNLKLIGSFMYNHIGEFLNYIKYGFCSYFMLTLLNFQNLTLLYFFLQIKLVPEFTKQIYTQLLRIYFYLESFENLAKKIFSMPQSKSLLPFPQQEEKIPEVIETEKKGMAWLGSFQISSLVVKNYLDNFFVLLLLVFKLLLFKVILKCFGLKFQKDVLIKSKFKLVILSEITTMIPGIVLSSFSRIVCSTINYNEKFQKSIQIIMYFFCITMATFHVLLKRCHTKKKIQIKQKILNQQAKQHKQIKIPNQREVIKNQLDLQKKKRRNKLLNLFLHKNEKQKKVRFNLSHFHHEYHMPEYQCMKKQKMNLLLRKPIHSMKKNKNVNYHLVDILLALSVPTFVVLGSSLLFLSCIGLIIILKFIYFMKQKKRRSIPLNLIQLSINLVWVFHHLVFLFLYFISLLRDNQTLIDNKTICEIVIVLGFIALITIISGFILQFVKFLYLTVYSVIQILKRLKIYCVSKLKIMEISTQQKQKLNIRDKKNRQKERNREKIKVKLVRNMLQQKKNSKERQQQDRNLKRSLTKIKPFQIN